MTFNQKMPTAKEGPKEFTMMQDMEWSVGHSVMAHWPSEISGIFTDLTSFDGSIFFQCQLCIENYVCF